MTKLTYPHDLYTDLHQVWNAEPLTSGWPRVDLPDRAVLDELLDVCYHASLMSEEGRPIVFRVALVSSTASIHPPREQPLPLEPIMRYVLGQPVPFTTGELRRLAPVADPRQVMIAVEAVGAGDRRRLQIYGLIDVGMALWEMARHQRISGTSSPEALVVVCTRPGELSICRGDHPVIRLRGGQVVRPLRSVLYEGPVAAFFVHATDVLIEEAIQRSGLPPSRVRRNEPDDGRDFAHVEFIESVLLHTAEQHHGGALLFVPDRVADDDPLLLRNISIKYHLPSTRARDALLEAMAVRLERNDLRERLHEQSMLSREQLEELEALDWNQREHEDSAQDAARFIASLTAVDGAVILTDQLRIIGFGAEVRVSDSGMDTIYHAKNEEGTAATGGPFTSYGTRHRSAFRFVEGMDPAVAFILSQDGGIKAATLVADKVVMWSYFEVGYTTALS
jgi:hypothetical protein